MLIIFYTQADFSHLQGSANYLKENAGKGIMMRSKKVKLTDELTRNLRQLISRGKFINEDAMNLVRKGADPNVKSVHGNSLLSIFTYNNTDGKYDLLIKELVHKHSANIDIKDYEGMTALQDVINKQPVFVEAAMFLVRLGANPDTRNIHGSTLLEILVFNSQIKTVSRNLLIEELVNTYHANIDIQNRNGRTLLSRLMEQNPDIDHVMNLIRLGADPDTKTALGFTVLHILCLHNLNAKGKYNHLIEELVKVHHADINLPDPDGDTVLKYVLDRNSLDADAAMKLVRLGANSDIKNKHGNTLLDLLILHEENTMIKHYKEELLGHRRSAFLSFLFILANDIHNKKSSSLFRKLPKDAILYILAYYPFEYLHKSPNEVMTLAIAVLSEPKRIKEMSSKPGGINIFQHLSGHHPVFKFYKSARSLCADYDNLKEKLIKEGKSSNLNKKQLATLNKFRDKYALSCWNEHSRLFSQHKSRSELFHQIKLREVYHDNELLARMKIK